tara:strand:+ start:182492 stop:182692 length:201 start_codon:yes stop_codon:yes gene_type:complete
MTDQEILDNAPEGATHIDEDNDFWKFSDSKRQIFDENESWFNCDSNEPLRSLADIRKIVELEDGDV